MSAAHCGARSMRSRWPVSGTTWTVALGMRAPRMRALTGGTTGSLRAAEHEGGCDDAVQPREAGPAGHGVQLAEVAPQRRGTRPAGDDLVAHEGAVAVVDRSVHPAGGGAQEPW